MAARSERSQTILGLPEQAGEGGFETIRRLHELLQRGGIRRATLQSYTVYRSEILSDRGSQFTVYTGAGVNTFDKGDVVVKCVKLRVGAEPAPSEDDRRERVTALYREVQVLTHSRLRAHPNILALLWYDFVDLSNKTYIPALIMERATLGNLDSLLYTSPQSLDKPGARIRICADITSALLALHTAGVVHGDVKSENILMFRSPETGGIPIPKIADFGSVIVLEEVRQKGPRRYYGTPLTNAPEVATSATFDSIGLIKCDNYSLGLVFVNILACQLDAAMTAKTPSVLQNGLELLVALHSLSNEDKAVFTSVVERLLPFNPDSRCGDLSIITKIFERSTEAKELIMSGADIQGLSRLSISGDSLTRTYLRVPEDMAIALESTFGRSDYLDIELDIELVSERDTQALLFDTLVQESKSPDPKVSGKALFQLSLASACGFGTPYNEDAALTFASSSASAGYLPAQATTVAYYMALGRQAELDLDTTIDWLFEATAWGSFVAASCLKQLDMGEFETARAEFHKAGGYNQFFYSSCPPPYIHSAEFAKSLVCNAELLHNPEELARSAAIYGDAALLKQLIAMNVVDVDLTTRWGESLTVLACKAGHLNTLRELVNAGAGVTSSSERESPLHWLIAFDEGDVDEAAALLKRAWSSSNKSTISSGTNPNSIPLPDVPWNYPSIDLPGRFPLGSPLHFAMFADSAQCTRAILSHFQDVLPLNWKGSSELSPFEYGLPRRKLGACEVLSAQGALKDPEKNTEALLGLGQRLCYENWVSTAIASGGQQSNDQLVNRCLDLVLISRPELLDRPDDEGGFTPLMPAVEYHDRATVKALLIWGCNVNARTSPAYDDRTALNLITENKTQHPPDDILDLLQAAGADFTHRTNPGGKLLIHFAARDDCLPIARALLDAGEDPNAPTTFWGLTPLHIAAEYGSLAVATLLLERGADPRAGHTVGTFNSFDWDCLTPLAVAALRQRTKIIRLLLENEQRRRGNEDVQSTSGSILARPPSQHTILHLAVAEPDKAILQSLLPLVMQDDPVNGNRILDLPAVGGVTALHLCAAQVGRGEHLRLLLDAGADSNALTMENGHSVLDIACFTRDKLRTWREVFVKLLLAYQHEGEELSSDDHEKRSCNSSSEATLEFLWSDNSVSLWEPLLVGQTGGSFRFVVCAEDSSGGTREFSISTRAITGNQEVPRIEEAEEEAEGAGRKEQQGHGDDEALALNESEGGNSEETNGLNRGTAADEDALGTGGSQRYREDGSERKEIDLLDHDRPDETDEETDDRIGLVALGKRGSSGDIEGNDNDPAVINVDDQLQRLDASIRLLISRGAVGGVAGSDAEPPGRFLSLHWSVELESWPKAVTRA